MALRFGMAPTASFARGCPERESEVVSLVHSMFPNTDTDKLMRSPKLYPKHVAYSIVGGKRMVIGFIFWKVKEEEDAVIYLLGVKDAYRMNGVGSSLIRHSLERVRLLNGGGRIVIHCRLSNPAKGFYDKIGFATSCVVKQYYANGEDAYEMTLDTEKEECTSPGIAAGSMLP